MFRGKIVETPRFWELKAKLAQLALNNEGNVGIPFHVINLDEEPPHEVQRTTFYVTGFKWGRHPDRHVLTLYSLPIALDGKVHYGDPEDVITLNTRSMTGFVNKEEELPSAA